MTDLSGQATGQPSGAAGGKPDGASRRVKLALYASLVLNLLFIGIVGGAILRGPPDRAPIMGRDLGFGPFTEALSPADRVALIDAFRRTGGGPREMRQAMRADFAAFVRVLRREPFDPAALDAAAAALKSRGAQRLELGQRLMMERIAQMSPEARMAFADRLEEMMARGPRRGDRDKPAD